MNTFDWIFPLIFSVPWLYIAGRWLYMRERGARSLQWPLSKAEILTTSTKTKYAGKGRTAFVLHIAFSYKVAGQDLSEHGEYVEAFKSLDEAEHMRAVFERGPFMIRYNPAKLGDYFVDPYRDAREVG